MGLTSTHTHTRFFDDEILDKITHLVGLVANDWNSRSEFVDEDTRTAGDARLLTLYAALMLCGESVAS